MRTSVHIRRGRSDAIDVCPKPSDFTDQRPIDRVVEAVIVVVPVAAVLLGLAGSDFTRGHDLDVERDRSRHLTCVKRCQSEGAG